MNYDEKLLSDADARMSSAEDCGTYVSDRVIDMRRRYLGDLARFRAFLACDPTALDGPVARSLLAWALGEVADDATRPKPAGHAAVLATIRDYTWPGWKSIEGELEEEFCSDTPDPYDGET